VITGFMGIAVRAGGGVSSLRTVAHGDVGL
jgi:hypothetical protein